MPSAATDPAACWPRCQRRDLEDGNRRARRGRHEKPPEAREASDSRSPTPSDRWDHRAGDNSRGWPQDPFVIRNAVIHIMNEQPLKADLFATPGPADISLVC